KDCKKNTTASISGQADKKPGASGRVFAITEGHAANTPSTITAAAGTEEEQAKNFQWGLRKSTLNHLMCMPFTDVAQVANAARNYEILHERDDDDAERPNKRQKSGEAVVTTTAAATTTTLATTTGIPVIGMTRETGVNSPTDLPILVFSSPGVPLRATPTRFALRVDADTQESVVELLAGKKPVHQVVFSPSLRIMLLRPQSARRSEQPQKGRYRYVCSPSDVINKVND
nr:hypothetical protein [Tanacetum cinerariifolium]